MKDVDDLTDKELQTCIDGSSSVSMIRNIFVKPNVIRDDGYIESTVFAHWFAVALEDYIEYKLNSAGWTEANNNNQKWGHSIADKINKYLEGNK